MHGEDGEVLVIKRDCGCILRCQSRNKGEEHPESVEDMTLKITLNSQTGLSNGEKKAPRHRSQCDDSERACSRGNKPARTQNIYRHAS